MGCLDRRHNETCLEVKRDDVGSYIFGWTDFILFLRLRKETDEITSVRLLCFALDFATNAKMYALPLG